MQEIIEGEDLTERHVAEREVAGREQNLFGRLRTDMAKHQHVDHKDPEKDLVDWPEPGRTDLGPIQPRHREQDQDRGEQRNHAEQLVRDRPQDRVERQVVPFRHDVRRSL